MKLAKAEVFEKGRSYDYLRKCYPEFSAYPTPFGQEFHPVVYTVDFKIHNLEKGQLPCSGHWHVDRAKTPTRYYLGIFGDRVCGPEFLRLGMSSFKRGNLTVAQVHQEAEWLVKAGCDTLAPYLNSPGFFGYTDRDVHRATPATAPGRRVLIRYNVPTRTLKENV